MYSSILEVDLNKLENNVRNLRRILAPEVKLCAVVKADAYGLGIAGVAGTLLKGGADLLGVARFDEAREIIRRLPDDHTPEGLTPESRTPDILVMGLCEDRELEPALRAGVLITLDTLEQAHILSEASMRWGMPARVHIKIDTGFSRLGLKATDPGSINIYREIALLRGIKIEGTFSHLALTSPGEDASQLSLFNRFCDSLEKGGISTGQHHICDSIGTARYPEYRMDMVRAGAVLYGMRPFRAPLMDNVELDLPVRWVSHITHVTRLDQGEGVSYDSSWRAPAWGAITATVPVGYVDGYPRNLSGTLGPGRGGRVLVQGVACPVIGLICMDQLILDVSAVPAVKRGDEAVLLGRTGDSPDNGEGEGITILELAEAAGTNRNEILARIGRRVLRRYIRDGETKAELAYLDEPAYREYN